MTVHFKLLALWINLGLKITKLHNVVEFVQKPFVAPFIQTCIEARRSAKNDFEKKLFKTTQVANFGYFFLK